MAVLLRDASLVAGWPFRSSLARRPSTRVAFDGRPGWRANLAEADDAFYVDLPLPGVGPDDVEVTVEENVLSVRAKRTVHAPEGARVLWQGFAGGEWRQRFTLPADVNPEKVAARLEHGVLSLVLPKADHVLPKTIKVASGEAGGEAGAPAAPAAGSSAAEPAETR